MASTRVALTALSTHVCRACLRAQTVRPAAQRIANAQAIGRRVSRPTYVPVRWHSAPSGSQVYSFDEMRRYSQSPSPDRIIIGPVPKLVLHRCSFADYLADVREPAEYEEGYIPGAINIPIKSQPDAMLLPEDEFEDRFDFPKPDMEKEVVFYCRSGVRSNAAAQLAAQHGYKNIKEYRGSWLDWQKHGGKEARPGMSTETTSGS